jgi:hypothetical protein
MALALAWSSAFGAERNANRTQCRRLPAISSPRLTSTLFLKYKNS